MLSLTRTYATTAYAGTYRAGFLFQPHFVLVVGDVDEVTLSNFLGEFYHRKHASYFQYHRVIVLHPDKPSEAIKQMLRTKYRKQLRYFTGSPLFKEDLDRVKAKKAKAIFILSVHDGSDQHQTKDTGSIVQALSIRKYDPSAATILQIRSAASVSMSLLASPTVMVCLQQIKFVRKVRNGVFSDVQQ